ncbi:MAG: glycosyltransferase family 87 protein [Terriglobia bacterium]
MNSKLKLMQRLRDLGIKEAFALLIAFLSLTYAITTAPRMGIDIVPFQHAGSEWLAGTRQIGEEPAGEYPPSTIVLFSILTLVSPEQLRVIWLGLNVASTVLIFDLLTQWIGHRWPFKAHFYLIALFLSWAPFRVTLRNGQLGLVITILILTMELAQRRQRDLVAGVLLGFSLSKFTLTFPFLLYYLFKGRWKIVGMTLLIPLILTQIYAFRMHQSLATVIVEYIRSAIQTHLAIYSSYMGSSEIKPLLLGLTGGNGTLSSGLSIGISLVALIAMAILFFRTPHCQNAHVAILTLFGLWTVYHRVHDSVLCVIPAALLVDFVVKGRFVPWSKCCLAALGLLAISIPGVLTARLKFSETQLSASVLGFLGLHIERMLVFGLFWTLLVLLWMKSRQDIGPVAGMTRQA